MARGERAVGLDDFHRELVAVDAASFDGPLQGIGDGAVADDAQ
jgi:hypothetical protein